MEEKDREIWVGENRFYLGEDNILYITVVGEQDEKTAIAMRDAQFKLISMVEGKVNFFVDNNKAGKASPEARKIFKELCDQEKGGKVAIFGQHPVARVLAFFVMGVAKKKDIRFFQSREGALAWLKE